MLEQEMTSGPAPKTCGWHASEACRRHVRLSRGDAVLLRNHSYHTTLLTRGIDGNGNGNRKGSTSYQSHGQPRCLI